MEERPIECSSCKKKACIVFKEISDGKTLASKVCSDCPVLKAKIGTAPEESAFSSEETPEGAACPSCKTSYQALIMGEALGCEHCYEAFEDLIVNELTHANLIPLQTTATDMNAKFPLHIGAVTEKLHEDITIRLESLNIALSEALRIENYERAASLRDQIQTLTKNPNQST